jgi:hypothetical protein
MYIIIRFNHNVGIIDHHCVNILKKNKQTKHKQTITKKKHKKTHKTSTILIFMLQNSSQLSHYQ